MDRPGSVQTEIAVACPAPDRSTPHGWAPHPVLAFVLGGSPNARVDALLREEKGYTYGIRTSFRPRVAGGSFVTQGSVRSEVTGEAVELLLSGEQREFPVVDNLGRVEGILTRDHIIKGLSQRGAGSIVGEVMAAQAPLVAPTLGFQEALERLRASGLPALPVVDGTGRLVGLLTMDNITDLLLVRRAGSAPSL